MDSGVWKMKWSSADIVYMCCKLKNPKNINYYAFVWTHHDGPRTMCLKYDDLDTRAIILEKVDMDKFLTLFDISSFYRYLKAIK